MRQISARLLSLIPGLIFLIQAYAWVTNPSKASNDLGMIYLEGIGRSTQIGDFSAFFISVSIFCLLGSIFKNISFLFAAVIVLSSAATMRIIAWQIYDASFAPTFIIVEIVSTTMILFSIFLIKNKNSKTQDNEKDNS